MWSAALLTLILMGHIDYGAVDLLCTYSQSTATERSIFIFDPVKCSFVVSVERTQTENLIFWLFLTSVWSDFFSCWVFRMQWHSNNAVCSLLPFFGGYCTRMAAKQCSSEIYTEKKHLFEFITQLFGDRNLLVLRDPHKKQRRKKRKTIQWIAYFFAFPVISFFPHCSQMNCALDSLHIAHSTQIPCSFSVSFFRSPWTKKNKRYNSVINSLFIVFAGRSTVSHCN